jgi:hypothetical protein
MGRHLYAYDTPSRYTGGCYDVISIFHNFHVSRVGLLEKFGSVSGTLLTFLVLPAIAYHTVFVLCILDLLFVEPTRWWRTPIMHLGIALCATEVVVLLQTANALIVALAPSTIPLRDLLKVQLAPLSSPDPVCLLALNGQAIGPRRCGLGPSEYVRDQT